MYSERMGARRWTRWRSVSLIFCADFTRKITEILQKKTCDAYVVVEQFNVFVFTCARNPGLRVGDVGEVIRMKMNIKSNFSSLSHFPRQPRRLQETHLHVLRRREVKPSPNPIWRNHRRTMHNVS